MRQTSTLSEWIPRRIDTAETSSKKWDTTIMPMMKQKRLKMIHRMILLSCKSLGLSGLSYEKQEVSLYILRDFIFAYVEKKWDENLLEYITKVDKFSKFSYGIPFSKIIATSSWSFKLTFKCHSHLSSSDHIANFFLAKRHKKTLFKH